MRRINRLVHVEGKYFDRFVEEITLRRPGSYLDRSWKKLTAAERAVKLSGVLGVANFNDDELKQIHQRVFRIELPVRKILIVSFIILAAAIAGFLAFQYYELKKEPVAYAIGNNVAVYDSPDPAHAKVMFKLDLYGRSPEDKKNTRASMSYVKDSGDVYVVTENDYFKKIMGARKLYYVHKNEMVRDQAVYNEYKRVFLELKNQPELRSLTAYHRNAIHACINSSKDFFNAIIHKSIAEPAKGKYQAVATAPGAAGESYLFLCLKLANGSVRNIKLVLQDNQYSSFRDITYLEGKFSTALQFKETILSPQQQVPIISFTDTDTKKVYQSFQPPYDVLIPQ